MKTQLLCTFVDCDNLHETIISLINSYNIIFNKIYVLKNEINHAQLLCTYNIEKNHENYINDVNTISLHRKKNTNTLYTINSLNEIIRLENNGKLDKSFSVDWKKYKNCLLLTNSFGFVKIPTKIYMIIDIASLKK